MAAGYSSLGFKDIAPGSERTNLAQVRKALTGYQKIEVKGYWNRSGTPVKVGGGMGRFIMGFERGMGWELFFKALEVVLS